MYDGYDVSRGMYLWEMLVMLRKVAIVAISSFVRSTYVQVRRASCGAGCSYVTRRLLNQQALTRDMGGATRCNDPQMVLAVVLIVAALTMHQTFRPYRSRLLNRLEACSLLTSLTVTVRC